MAFVLFFVTQCSVFASQRNASTEFDLSDLKSADVQKRIAAFDKIKSNPDALERPEVKAALIDLLDRENTYHATPPEATGVTSEDDDWEGYGDYWSDLADTVDRIADWHNPRQLCILARSSYGPLSSFAQKLATNGGSLVAPCLLKMSRGNKLDRDVSLSGLVMVLAFNQNLLPALRQEINQAILIGLRDPESFVRDDTVIAVGKYGKPEMIPVLEGIAQTDPYSHLVNEKPVFDVREAAARAIRAIQDRAKAH